MAQWPKGSCGWWWWGWCGWWCAANDLWKSGGDPEDAPPEDPTEDPDEPAPDPPETTDAAAATDAATDAADVQRLMESWLAAAAAAVKTAADEETSDPVVPTTQWLPTIPWWLEPMDPNGGKLCDGKRDPGVRNTLDDFFLFFHLARRFWNQTFRIRMYQKREFY